MKIILFLLLAISPALAAPFQTLNPASSVNDTDIWPVVQSPGSSPTDAKYTALMFKQYVLQGQAATVVGFNPVTGKVLVLDNNITLSGTDGATLNVGAGGTLGSAAFDAASAFDAAGSASTAQASAVSAAETNAAALYIPLAGSTSITGNLGANSGTNWEIVEATGAVSLAGGSFQVDASGDTQLNSLIGSDDNTIVDNSGSIYFGSNAGLALDNQGQVWWSNWNYSPTVLADNLNQLHYGDGGLMTTYNEVLYADRGAIVLGDGTGDGSASFGSAFFGGAISSYDWNIATNGSAEFADSALTISSTGTLSGSHWNIAPNGSASFATGILTISSTGTLSGSNWNIAPSGIASFDGGAITLGDGTGSGNTSFGYGVLTISSTTGLVSNSGSTWHIASNGGASFASGEFTISGVGNVSTVGSIALGNSLTSGSHIWSGTGAPSTIGINGDFYFRTDGSTGTHLYFKASGSWTGIL